MNALATALASILLAGPADAASQTVYRPPITVTGKVSTAELAALQTRVEREFARTDFDSVMPVDPSACTTAPCWRAEADATGTRYIASLSVDASGADQRLSMNIVDLNDGSTAVKVDRTCELCGRDELLDATADLCATALRKLQSQASITTEIAVDSIPTGARVVLDGQEQGTTPIRIEVSPGPHTVELSAAGYDSFSQPIDLERGTTESVRLRLSASVQSPPPPSTADLSSTPTRRRKRVVLGAALLGGGVAASAAGVTLLVLHGRPITADCSGSDVDVDGDCHFLHDTLAGGIVGLSAGAAALIGGAVLLGVELRRDRPGTVALSPTPSGLRLRGRF